MQAETKETFETFLLTVHRLKKCEQNGSVCEYEIDTFLVRHSLNMLGQSYLELVNFFIFANPWSRMPVSYCYDQYHVIMITNNYDKVLTFKYEHYLLHVLGLLHDTYYPRDIHVYSKNMDQYFVWGGLFASYIF